LFKFQEKCASTIHISHMCRLHNIILHLPNKYPTSSFILLTSLKICVCTDKRVWKPGKRKYTKRRLSRDTLLLTNVEIDYNRQDTVTFVFF